IRGTATPDTPTGGTTAETHLPSGWTRTNPGASTTHNVYRAIRTRTYDASGSFGSATVWGGVAKVEDATGTSDQPSSAPDYVYIRDTSTPDTPTGGRSTYAHTPAGWSRTNPGASTTHNVYRAERTRSFSSQTQNSSTFTSATDWSNVTKVEDATGDPDPPDDTDEPSSDTVTYYLRGTRLPAAAPTTTRTRTGALPR
ncbi:MAG: hypothetical protein OXH50_13340, partial [Gemmatimonadetes bacterium]|nr:hypothetical protein [Gemmatimonadota bacterium]